MRKFILVSAVLAALITPAAAMASPAVADPVAHHHVFRPASGNDWFTCSENSMCLYLNDSLGAGSVFDKPATLTWVAEDISNDAENVCAGSNLVTFDEGTDTGCPFTVPSLDAKWAGDYIRKYRWSQEGPSGGDCLNIPSGGSTLQGTTVTAGECSGTGHFEYVSDHNSDGSNSLISVYASDQQSESIFVCDSTNNSPSFGDHAYIMHAIGGSLADTSEACDYAQTAWS